MKKYLIYTILIGFLLFTSMTVFAEESDDVKDYVDPEDSSAKFSINKSQMLNPENVIDDTVQIKVGEVYFSKLGQLIDKSTTAFFFTTTDDPIYTDYVNNPPDKRENLWWSSLYVCYVAHGGFGDFFSENTVVIATDSMASLYKGPNKDNLWDRLFDYQDCSTYVVQGVSPDKKLSTCKYYNDKVTKINSYLNKYKSEKKLEYRNKYLSEIYELKSACSQAFSSASYNDACVNRCLTYNEDKTDWDKGFNLGGGNGGCGITEKVIAWIKNILSWLKFIAPVLVILIGIVDFIRAVASAKDDEMKKAQSRFVRRLIAAALVFIVPAILVFVFEKMGFTTNGCGIINL